jgi:hypothetical protein
MCVDTPYCVWLASYLLCIPNFFVGVKQNKAGKLFFWIVYYRFDFKHIWRITNIAFIIMGFFRVTVLKQLMGRSAYRVL